MANVDNDEGLEKELAELDDFNVIPRPQELIDLQKQSSTSKTCSSWTEVLKRTSPFSTETIDRKPPKSKEKRSKHERKGSCKEKHFHKSPLNEGSPLKKYTSIEQDKFESFVRKIKSTIAKQRIEKKKMFGLESGITGAKSKSSSDITGSKSKLFGVIGSRNKLPDLTSSKSKSSDVTVSKSKSSDVTVSKSKSSDVTVSKSKSSDVTVTKSKSSDQNIKSLDIQPSKLMAEPAMTFMQKFQVLEARDAVLRARESKEGSSKKVKILGTCPDMCPEKERYCRIAKNCLSVLETKTALDQNETSRDADHCYMVKEYSRSSADQQEPLPHELRPISVLNFTMDYLICNIMDIPLNKVSLADWYDFIWNRTRSIRKDITQQQLCDIRAVEIIEKCVRFHIHCAEALSEEDTATFDPKINNENLTKCLQTLKHMYHDLQSKGIHSPNEAEFRSYDILLSLTEGETLRLIKDIRKDLLKSPLIKSAFEAALAFKSHNYAKFFKIIEKADYLSSCILHRYIIEGRIRALQIIVRAYSTPHSVTVYPTSSLVKDLKFENASEACEFCKCHGLEANETYVTIERRHFSKSASGLPESRSYLLVGSKRGKSLGKIINKGEIPPNPLYSYKPHDSFDERNMLKINSLGSITKGNEKLISTDIDMEEKIETEEDTSFPKAISANNTISISEKNAVPEIQIKDANIQELEKARAILLKKLSKMKDLNEEKLKQKQTELLKNAQKIKDKKSDSAFNLKVSATFPVKSSDVSAQKVDDFKPLEKANSFFGDTFKSHDQISSVKGPSGVFSKLFQQQRVAPDLTRPFSPVNFSDFFKSNTVPRPTTTASSIPTKTDVPTSKSSFRIRFPFDLSKNFSVQATPSVSAFNSNFNVESEPLTYPQRESRSGKYSAVDEGIHSTEDELSSSGKSSLHEEEGKAEFVTEDTQEKTEVQETTEESQDKETEVSKTTEELEVSSCSSIEVLQEVEETPEERHEDDLDKFVELVAEDLYSECLEECSISICEEVLNDEKRKQAELENEYEIIRTNLARKVILKWKLFCDRKRHRRILQNSTFHSPWQPMLINTPYISSGAQNPIKAYNRFNSLNKLAVEKITQSRRIPPGWEVFKTEEIWPSRTFKPHPSAYLGKNIRYFFKLCIVFPARCDSSVASVFVDWIADKFSLKKTETFEFPYWNTYCDGRTLISVRAVQLDPAFRSSYIKFLDGVTAMILFLPETPKVMSSFFEDFTLLLNSDTLQCPYPLVVYLMETGGMSSDVLAFLQDKLDSKYFTNVQTEYLHDIENFTENSRRVLESLRWLIHIESKKFSHPWLDKSSVRNYMEDSYAFAFNILLCKASLNEFKCLKQMPQQIIDFYNKAIRFRAKILCSDLIQRIHSSWPPEEVKQYLDKKFIDLQIQNMCKEALESSCLPNFGFNRSTASLGELWDYIECICDTFLMNRMDRDMLLMKIRSALGYLGASFDWLYILNVCALHLIQTQAFKLPVPPEEIFVYYARDDMESFDCEKFWFGVMSAIRYDSVLKVPKRKNESSINSPVKKKKVVDDVPTPDNLTQVKEKSFISNPFDMPDMLNCQRDSILNPLKAAFAEQMEQSDAFSKRLDESFGWGNVKGKAETCGENLWNDPPFATPKSDPCVSGGLYFSFRSPAVDKSNTLEFSFGSTLNATSTENSYGNNDSYDLFGVTINNSKEKSCSSIADKLAELKYKIERHHVLEDHYSQLLHKQL